MTDRMAPIGAHPAHSGDLPQTTAGVGTGL